MSSELHFRVLRLLETNPHLSQRELSKSLGVNLGGINYSLNALITKGAVKIENFKNNQNKWVYAYLLPPPRYCRKNCFNRIFHKA